MAAGISVPYDNLGLQTADLINNQWPLRFGEVRPKEYSKSSTEYGVHVPCHAGQSFQAPCLPAGMSLRMGAFYEKTGVSQHRTEPGFRDKKGAGTLTELPLADYGTLRRSTRLPGTATLVLDKPPSVPHSTITSQRSGKPDLEVMSNASRRSRQSHRSQQSRASRASGASRRTASSAPSWAKRTQAQQERQPWNFEALPFYDRTNASYGRTWQQAASHAAIKPAGKSESGYVDPAELIATLTREY
ncbi:unnamed protein product [Durusdinium trenchii]|uniref:Uncharacterized protein n=2 Tax=Durusdinium trenchii TaxID=1381693 RepID=A0ABP0JNA1_9DINO